MQLSNEGFLPVPVPVDDAATHTLEEVKELLKNCRANQATL